MKLRRLEIHNYKSLRNVVIEPASLSVFVGPNAAGKSNFADALDFLAEVYRWDLEGAVKKKGGFENILFRQAKVGESIRFRVVLEGGELGPRTLFDHTFVLKSKARGARSPFKIWHEKLTVHREVGRGEPVEICRIVRNEREVNSIYFFEKDDAVGVSDALRVYFLERLGRNNLAKTDLFLSVINSFFVWARDLPSLLGSLRVFQLNPRQSRQDGIPTPDPDLDRFGGNLPAVIDHLKREYPDVFRHLLEAVRRVAPSIEAIETDLTHTRTLGLFLREADIKHPWAASDISDGTIQTIALLAATFDPRIPILVIEEPENSVHPWAIRNFVQAFRTAAEQKQIFLTTHSPILIDQIRPEELWVVQRPALETKITPVLELDPSLQESWGQGKFTLSEYLDSGALPEAVPAPGI